MSGDKIYVGDVGTEISIDVGYSLAAATTHNIRFRRPSGSTGQWVGFTVDQTLRYITQAGDLNEGGDWVLQAYIVLPNWTGLGSSVTMRISPVFT